MRFVQKNFATDMKYPFETLGGAVAALDYDNDGRVDLLFLNGAPSPEHVRTDPATFNRLFRNTGGGRFVDVTLESGLSGAGIKGYPQGVAVGDYDNDGHVDVLVTNYGDNVLYHNEGNGRFTDVTARAGVAMPRYPLKASAAFLDFDNDGWLDLFVTHYFQWTLAENADDWCGRREKGHRIYCDPDVFKPLPNALLRNNRDGTFTDVSDRGRPRSAPREGDGRRRRRLRRGRADGRLRHQRPGAALPVPQRRGREAVGGGLRGRGGRQRDGRHGLGHGLRLQGLRRRRLARHLPDRPDAGHLHAVRNQGKGFFLDRTFPSGIGGASAGHSGWSTKLLDLDNDGAKDIFVAGSHVVDNVALYSPGAKYEEGCFLYRNTGQGRIEDLSANVGPDLTTPGAWRGVAVADLDNDGTLEVAVSRLNGHSRPLREEGRGAPQLDPAGPRGHPEQPGRHRRARPARAALGPHAPRARDHRERDLLRERQARALRAGRGIGHRLRRDLVAQRDRAARREARHQPGPARRGDGAVTTASLLLALSLALPASPEPPRRHDADLKKLDASLAAGDAEATEALLRRLQPGLDADPRFALDAIYVFLGRRRFSEAKDQWNRLAPRLQESLRGPSGAAPSPAAEKEQQRRVAEALFVQGLLTARAGPKDEALRLLQQADGYGFPPLDSPLMLLAADGLSDLQEPTLAVQAYRAFLERSPADVKARLRLGAALYSSGQVGAAEKELREVLRRGPDTPQAHYLLGAVLFEQKRTEEARTHLEQELALDPACAGCLAKLAHIAYLAGDDRQCEAWLAKAAALDPEHVETNLVSGMLENRTGQYEQAIRHLSRVVEQSPAYAKAQYQLALAYQRSGNAPKAREHLEIYNQLIQAQKARDIGVRGSKE